MRRGKHRISFLSHALLLAVAVGLCLAQVASASTARISGPASQDGEVVDYKIASTGAYAVYKTFYWEVLKGPVTPRLYSVSLNGGQPVSLSAPLPPSEVLTMDFDISPDGSRVIYTAYQESINYLSLYTVPIQGGTNPKRLSQPGQSPFHFVISSDSQWVVFATRDNSNKTHLYRAPLAGNSPAVEITFPGAADLSVNSLRLSPDSQHLLFSGQLSGVSDRGVYCMPIMGTGSQAVRLTRAVLNPLEIWFRVTPDSQYLVYLHLPNSGIADQRLYSVPLDGPAADDAPLNEPLVAGGQVRFFDISPDSQRVVFVADGELLYKNELYSTSLVRRFSNGQLLRNVPIKLNVALPNKQGVRSGNVVISPDSSRVAYFVNHSGEHDLFSVPIAGPVSANVRLNHPIDPTFHIDWRETIRFSPDSSRIVFTAMQDTPDLIELYSVPAAGPDSAATKLNGPIVKDSDGYGRVEYPLISQDGKSVFYVARTQSSRDDLFQVPIEGPATANLNLINTTDASRAIGTPLWVPGQPKVAYLQSDINMSYYGGELFLYQFKHQVYLPAVMP